MAGAGSVGRKLFSVRVKGRARIERKLRQLEKDVPLAARRIMLEQAQIILEVARLLAPIKTGRLRESGRVIQPRQNATKTLLEFKVVFGGIIVRGIAVDYAERIHDEHPTRSNYLKEAFELHKKALIPRLEREIRAAVRR